MLAAGIVTSIVVTLLWVSATNAFMHLRPAENRFRAMLVGYLLSLPVVFLTFGFLAWTAVFAAGRHGGESWALGLAHLLQFRA